VLNSIITSAKRDIQQQQYYGEARRMWEKTEKKKQGIQSFVETHKYTNIILMEVSPQTLFNTGLVGK